MSTHIAWFRHLIKIKTIQFCSWIVQFPFKNEN